MITFLITLLIIFVLLIVLALVGFIIVQHNYNDEVMVVEKAKNPYIAPTGKTMISAHRSGADIAPENTLMAFESCVKATEFKTDLFEFDLHITKDNQLILLHDETFDRTSNSIELFGKKGVKPAEKTFEELSELNMGENFTKSNGETPFKGLRGKDIPLNLKVVRLDDILSFLQQYGDYGFIIELKNGKELGKKAADVLYQTLKKFGKLDKAIIGTFHKEVSQHMQTNYPDMHRSASVPEGMNFYFSSLFGINHSDDYYKFNALQTPYKDHILNMGTSRVVNYAHKYNMAVQYWTINKPEDVKHLQRIGADAIMSDDPLMAYNVINNIK